MTDSLLPSDATVDLTNCDREPIHQLGAIQPIGFLLVMTSDWNISNASANIGEFLDLPEGDLIGRSATAILSKHSIHALRNRLALLRTSDAVERVFRLPLQENGRPFDVAIHTMPTGEFGPGGSFCSALSSDTSQNRSGW